MRLVTWNCARGRYTDKVPLLAPFGADISVIQECPKPDSESEHCLWFGENPKQGIVVLASADYRLRRLPLLERVPNFVLPIGVSGPVDFTLFAIWSKKNKQYPYIQGVVKAVEMYNGTFAELPCMLMGDFNSNVIWDNQHPAHLNHSALMKLMGSLSIGSAYHTFFDEAQGEETRPTYYHLWNEKVPFHIDYCFVPTMWMNRLRHVEVGGYEDWKGLSDHRPLLVDVAV